MIKRETIDKIMEASRIEEVIGEFVNLKRSGKNMKGFSPFTNETNASFFVSPSKNIFKCFSSGKGGNVVSFLMEHEHFSYPEALRYLARKYNIEIEEKEPSPEELMQLNEREALFHLNAFAQKSYTDNLFDHEEGKAICLSYLKERGYRDETIRKFQLGYGLKAWDAFSRHADNNGYKKEYLLKTGLSIEKEDRIYDRFRNRAIFPVHNLSGRILGFGGRILVSDENKPKYVNSPESEVYIKSQILYGLYFAKNAIIREDNCYLVEGYTDVITLHQAGIENVVASSGTSLTSEQIKLIKRYTANISILYDGDTAGIKAAFRGIDLILEEGMNVKIVLFPEGEDPDSFAMNHRSNEVISFIEENANDFIKFKTQLLKKEAANDPVKKAGLIREIVESISLIPDAIYRTVYIKECSSILDIPEQTLMNELNKMLRKRFQQKGRASPVKDIPEPPVYAPPSQHELDPQTTEHQERNIIRLLLNYGSDDIAFEEIDEMQKRVSVVVKVAQFIVNDLKEDEIQLQDPVYHTILNEYILALEKEFIPDEQYFVNHENADIARIAVDLLSTPYELSKNWVKNKIIVPT
ncbi:MAG: DNA primase, partial [Bacteroidota bacterium]|nr:DNA primase [Bacteroidota bacterium]